jgi:hypothetical protein
MSKSPNVRLEPRRALDGKPMTIAGLVECHQGTNAGIPARWI